MKNLIYILLSSILLISCGDSVIVRFKTPQPVGVKPADTFNRKVRGTYIHCSDKGDKLMISHTSILNQRVFEFRTHRNDLEIDSTVSVNRYNNQDLEGYFNNNGFSIEFHGDTLKAFASYVDTIFQVSEEQVLKKFKGSYFLNTKVGESKWEVNRLDINKKQLVIGEITPSDTLLRFDFVEKNEEKNELNKIKKTEYSITPTKKEFKRLIKSNTFNQSKCYRKKK